VRRIRQLVSGILAGICIGIGGAAFLSLENKVLGALFFTVGLFTICTQSLALYTGRVCYVFQRDLDYGLDLPFIWGGNLAGTFLTARALLLTRTGGTLSQRAAELCGAKLGDSPGSVFLLSVLCNILIYIAVEGFSRNPHELGKYLSLFFGVTVFILCGFEHCVANMFYLSLAGAWSGKAFLYVLVMTAGNSAGGVLFPVLRRWLAAPLP